MALVEPTLLVGIVSAKFMFGLLQKASVES